ncbi:hypothetical protein D1BOALGB6SA_8817 [Olavius sp. associated proteobacterium Delta 1]|nr:hypothetical protein D1BOALGB6SA_8817 [Olavius sp. associated proteobacterium Delta 1]
MPTGSWHALVMNTTVAPFSDIRVRTAMKRVVDRRKMIDLVLRGHGMVAHDHPVWSQDPFYLKLDRPQDFKHVRALLTEAGYPEGLDVELTVADVNAYMIPMAVAYKDMAAKAGIRVTIKLAKAGAYWSEHWMKTPFFGTRWTERPADLILNEGFRSGAKWNEAFWMEKRSN